jgi:hypothetical protein
MPILKPNKNDKFITVSAKLPETLKKEIDDYIQFAELNSMNEFLCKASEWVLSKDKEWHQHKQI